MQDGGCSVRTCRWSAVHVEKKIGSSFDAARQELCTQVYRFSVASGYFLAVMAHTIKTTIPSCVFLWVRKC